MRWTASRRISASVKNAVLLMIVITVGIVFVGGVIVSVFDKQDFPDLGSALWYTLQTVTTVGTVTTSRRPRSGASPERP